MKKHSNKEIRDALDFAEKNGWTIEKSKKGHAWGVMYCPNNDSECRCGIHCMTSIWSTPKSPSNHARQLKRIVEGCIYYKDK
jgi:hypothetical protein